MAIYTTLGAYRFPNPEDAVHDIRGSKIYGLNDEKLGEIDDVIFDQATGVITFAVVDTGGWLKSHKFVVPQENIHQSLVHERAFQVELTKKQIESFPPYDESHVADANRWEDYERRYRSHWANGPIMHRDATDRNITPTTKQQLDAGSGSLPSTEEEDTSPVTPMRTEASLNVDPSGPSLHWTTFEDRLRLRREEVLESSLRLAKERQRPTLDEVKQKKAS
ncbi:MAG TPA: PRC-barrel domain-containing protein [Terriglobales bacterium]|nr:PRC-barrel domain-containing protein [Terriglobales bacterium]